MMQPPPAPLRSRIREMAVLLSSLVARPIALARDGISRAMIRQGIPVNALTLTGLVAASAVAVPLYYGSQPLAGAAMIIAGACDILDGAVARLSNRVTTFGGYLDSVVDRYSDFAILFGLLAYIERHWEGSDRLLYLVLWSLVVVGSSTTAYTRARAEVALASCKVGFMERPERTVTLLLGLLCRNVHMSLWILAVMSNLIALQRILYTRLVMENRRPSGRFWLWTYGRLTTPHFALCVLFIVMLVAAHHLVPRP